MATLLLLRPTLMDKVRSMPGYRSSTDKMVGSTGVAVSADRPAPAVRSRSTGRAGRPGRTTPDLVIEQGTEVEVYEIDGAIAVVYPKHGQLP